MSTMWPLSLCCYLSQWQTSLTPSSVSLHLTCCPVQAVLFITFFVISAFVLHLSLFFLCCMSAFLLKRLFSFLFFFFFTADPIYIYSTSVIRFFPPQILYLKLIFRALFLFASLYFTFDMAVYHIFECCNSVRQSLHRFIWHKPRCHWLLMNRVTPIVDCEKSTILLL